MITPGADAVNTATSSRDVLAALLRDNLPREHGFESLTVEGQVPDDLVGTLYRNGPVLFELFGRRYGHPFEGDGGVSAARFFAGEVSGAATITRTAGLTEERAAGRMLYSFSAPRWRRLWNTHISRRGKNTANTNVIAWQGQLYALMEAGLPTAIDPETLETGGESDLGGAIRGAFSAHPHRVAAREATYNFGVRYGRTCALDLYELPDRGPARHLGELPLPFAPMLHDFVATHRYLVFFVSPVALSVSRFLRQKGGFADLWSWQPERGTEVICAPIDDPSSAVRFAVDPFYQWHFANAFDRGDDIVIDVVRYADFSSFYELGDPSDAGVSPGLLYRMVASPKQQRLAVEPLGDCGVEFPRVHPDVEGAEHQLVWMTAGDLDRLACYDAATGELEVADLPDGWVSSELVFAPRPSPASERDGYLLGLVYDAGADRSGVAVWDAGRSLGAPPLATAWFDHRIPMTFHGAWVPEAS